jgi:uncharacterized membrane protein
MLLIPIPLAWAAILLMGGGVLCWLLLVSDVLRWAHARFRGEEVDTVWDSEQQDFVPNTLTRRRSAQLILFLLGTGFFTFGYVTYTGLVWDLLGTLFSPAYFPLVVIAAVVLLLLVFGSPKRRTN